MNEISSTQFDGMCRTCMACNQSDNSTENIKLQSVFEYCQLETKIHIFEMFNCTMQVIPKIELRDHLPKGICQKCLDKLSAFYEFQQICISADNQFRKLLATSGVEEKYIVDTIHNTLTDPLQGDTIDNPEILEIEQYIKQELQETESSSKKKVTEEQQVDIEDSSSDNETVDSQSSSLKIHESTNLKRDSIVSKSEDSESIIDKPLTKNGSSVCEFCNKTYANKKSLRKHIKRLHNTDSSIQLCINKPLTTSGSLNCEICEKTYANKKSLRKHIKRLHNTERTIKFNKKCEYCDLVGFQTVKALRNHYQLSHKDVGNIMDISKQHICQYCNKGFQQSCTLKDHIRIHTKEQPFLCSHCGKAFNSNSNLQQHILRHTGERRYECPDCPKKFPCLSDLSSHKQVHKKNRPHVCDICGAAFGKPVQLKRHKMYHSGEKPYQCEYCEMRFVLPDHRRRHTRIHTGEKPYQCKYCTRTFTQPNDMTKHLRLHLGENVYQCELCPMAFRLAAELREHFAVHKNDDEETRERNRKALLEAQEKLRMKLELDRAIGTSEHRK